ncbi:MULTISPECIES: SEC10/PgrA surface exclusion domain-containing protein [Lactobacillus]|uniref:SEC10/PgrA surface exclusion domain-containing protein n=1 Tax=Lactobacillus xujianguonis TaxID=2495899 RepID=A0A437ST47_9LACO|nr:MULTISPECIES: SEC10/PgrA surface exclusion domain-containing protein [Lactobacillus]RVU70078.1 SEC10/PgrA surface exclusion domain-containing protein [Lactobacillus xujianguonis]RVU77657.1 SEC10/PgrA surface exclusion domain-containing protein [Lactobacillus xujianguonis]
MDEANAALKEKRGQTAATQKKVDDAKSAVIEQQKAVDEKAQAVGDAQKQVGDAQAALDGTGFNEAQKSLADINATIKQEKDDLAKKQKQVEDLTNDVANKKETISKLDLSGKKAALIKAGKNAGSVRGKLEDLKALSKGTDSQINSDKDEKKRIEENQQNNIVISNVDKYKKALLDYNENNQLTQDDIDYMNENRALCVYKSSEQDKGNKVNLRRLENDQIVDLSLFAANLINKVRAQFGWKATDVSSASLMFAKRVAKNYLQDDASYPDWHDVDGLDEAMRHYDLLSYSEDMGPADITSSRTNMDELKKNIYNLISRMIFTDGNGVASTGADPTYELAHAKGVLGVTFNKESNSLQPTSDYLAVIPTIFKDNKVAIHILRALPERTGSYKYPSYNEKLLNIEDELTNTLPNKRRELNVEIAKAEKELTIQENDAAAKQTAYSEAHNQYVKLSDQIDKETQAVNDLINNQIPALNSRINDDGIVKANQEKKVKDLTKTHQTKADALSDVKQDLETAKSNLQSAKDELAKKQTSFDTTKKEQQSLNDAIDTLQKKTIPALENAQKDAQTKLDKLQKAGDILKKAQDAETETEKANKDAQDKLTDAQNQLKALLPAKQAADKAVNDTQTDLDNAQKKLNDAQAKLEQAQQEENAQHMNIFTGYNDTSADDFGNYIPDATTNTSNAVPAVTTQTPAATPTQTPNTTQTKTPEVTPTTDTKVTPEESTKANLPKMTYKKITLTRNAVVYDKHGKAIKKGVHKRTIKKGKILKALKNAKIVKIKGKKYFQIGRNKFIKVNSAIVVSKVNFKAQLKGIRRVKAYNRLGKFNKHYLRAHHRYSFTQKAIINGKTYYKVAHTNNWVPASKVGKKIK